MESSFNVFLRAALADVARAFQNFIYDELQVENVTKYTVMKWASIRAKT